MPSLRQRVSTYFRQLSFIAAEPRETQRGRGDTSFITRYLEEGGLKLAPGPEILSGKEPSDLPDLPLLDYDTSTLVAATTGPEEGLCAVKRSKLHLSAGYQDIEFIDQIESQDDIRQLAASSSVRSLYKQQSFRATADQNANKQQQPPQARRMSSARKNSTPSVHQQSQDVVDKQDSDSLNRNDADKSAVTRQESLNEVEQASEAEEVVPVAGVVDWKQEADEAFGLSVSLYEKNPLTNENAGSPIADCFGLVARRCCAALALADGVNWGENARLAARAAVNGCLDYIDTAIFGHGPGGTASSTREVFISLLRSFWEAHACILEVGGALSTLTVAVILPLTNDNTGKFCVCSCNVGDSLGYVYSKLHGVREFTQGSHDITTMRDMRDALGALGPVHDSKPELSNLTLSFTVVEAGDIVFLTSDGISDNFDPVVGKFAEAMTAIESQAPKTAVEPQLAPKRQNKSTSYLHARKSAPLPKPPPPPPPERPPRTKKPSTVPSTSKSAEAPASTTAAATVARPKYFRSHTVIEPRLKAARSPPAHVKIPKSAAGLPLVTGSQRHALTLLRLVDLFSYGINGTLRPCSTAKRLCHLLVDFARMITAAKRKILEQRELYYKISVDPTSGMRREIEMTKNQQRAARKRVVEGSMFTSLPGKLDHASCVAYKVGTGAEGGSATTLSIARPSSYTETNF